MNKYLKVIFFLILSFFLFLLSTDKKEDREKNDFPFYLHPSSKEKGRLEYYERFHASTKNWRLIDEKNKINRKKSVLDTILGSWYEIASKNQAGRIHTFDWDSIRHFIYAASASGQIWQYNQQSPKWKVLNDFFRIPDIVYLKTVYQNNQLKFFVASGTYAFDGFYYSLDTCKSFVKAKGLENIQNGGHIKRVLYTEINQVPLFYILAESELNTIKYTDIFLSRDMGKTFLSIRSEIATVENRDIATGIPQSGELILASLSNITKIDTSGQENVIGSIQLVRSGSILLQVYHQGTTLIPYLAVYADNQTDFYAKGIVGWEFRSYLNENPFMVNSFAVSSANSNVLYFGGVNAYKSSDGIYSWQKVNDWKDYYGSEQSELHADIPAIKSFKNQQKEFILIASDGGVYYSDNQLKNVYNLSLQGLNNSQYYSVLSSGLDSGKILLGSQDQGLQQINNLQLKTQNSFMQILSGDFGHLVSATNLDDYWLVYPGFIAYSKDLSLHYTWGTQNQLWLPPIATDKSLPNSIYYGGSTPNGEAKLYKLLFDKGNITSSIFGYNFSSFSKESISAIAVSPFDDQRLFVLTTTGRFFSSSDGGNSWSLSKNFAGPQAQYFYGAKILCSKLKEDDIYIAGSAYENNLYPVYFSHDKGKSFQPVGTGLSHTLVSGLALSNDESILFAASEIGAYAYFQNDSAWINISDSIAPDVPYWDVEFVPQLNIARFATYGRGVWDFELRSEACSFLPIVKKNIPDILIASIDTILITELDSFFAPSSNNELIYSVFEDDTTIADLSLFNNKKLFITPKKKGLTRILITAYDIDGSSNVDDFYLNTSYNNSVSQILGDKIKLFPNPTTDFTCLAGLDINANYQLVIYNLSGKMFYNQRIIHESEVNIDLQSFSKASYILQIKNEQKNTVSRLKLIKN